jgi:hypothetical protein
MYSASGDAHVAEALASARSSMRANHVPHVVFAPESAKATDLEEGLSIEVFEPSDNPYVDKIVNMSRSPFDRTLYLDTDTYVLHNITHVLNLLDQYDLVASHAPARRRLNDPGVPRAFCELNTGVVGWETGERSAAFLESWKETYEAWQREPPFHLAAKALIADQPAFRHCVWASRMHVMILPPEYNYRPGTPGAVAGPVRVIHGRHHDYEAMAAKLNKTPMPRSFPGMTRAGKTRPKSPRWEGYWPDEP